ncbi:hypothetical protein SCLCIDRAFT_28607 [Scleroderma citrinum Foug A]|uniref:Uncharacterized protein n=1 Tax=Scleroderma citrinum Foug A TaxID=1036808 RepID=A0A0C3DP33_9AGAM|nr:hypothetical protein SCLCIDRAFT_28607 [Scleroderma citrinum Foug A]
MEWEWMEIQRVHLAIMRRATDQDEERLELEWTPFIYSAKGKEKEVKAEAEVEEKGEEADDEDEDEDEDVQGEEE